MRVLALYTAKGGTGKSTAAARIPVVLYEPEPPLAEAFRALAEEVER